MRLAVATGGICLALLALGAGSWLNAATPKTNAAPGIPTIVKSEDDQYWKTSWHEVYKQVPELIAQHESELQRNIRRDKLMHGNLAKKQIALTFDDGPHPKYTPKILAILQRANVKATFFVVGMLAEQHPELIKAEMNAGHSVGNHTYHHVNLTKIPEGYIATEIDACGNVLERVCGCKPHLFRPPGGDYNDKVAEVAEALKYKIILWTDDPGDYANPGQRAIQSRTLDKASNGGIILIHDGVQQTIDVLPKIISELKKRGYEFVTIDQMVYGNGSN